MTHSSKRSNYIPSRGERLERRRFGVALRGTVLYSDQVQVLVKWDDGRSSSLRLGVDDVDLTYAEFSSEGDTDRLRETVGHLNSPPERRPESNEVAVRIGV
jgi:hypothetical protein